jgi:arabinofuranosyltransferase
MRSVSRIPLSVDDPGAKGLSQRLLGVARAGSIYIAPAAILGAYFWHCLAVNYLIDDSFITLRYAKNLVAGYGLVYNPGERVEGYTNFLWAVLLGLFGWLRPGVDLVQVAQALGVIFGAVTLLLVIQFSRRLHGGLEWGGLIAATFLALNGSFVAWSTGGLETTMFACLVFSAAYAYLIYLESSEKYLLAPFLFALAALTRPEGLLFFGVTAVHFGWRTIRQDRRAAVGRLAVWCLPFVAIYLPYFAWRYSYYGFLLPNTFYAKVGAGIIQYLRGIRYVFDYVFGYGALVFLFPLALLLRKNRKVWSDYLLLQTALFLLYIVYVGGDGLGFFRFIAFIAPFIYVLAQEGFLAIYESARHSFRRRISSFSTPLAAALLGIMFLLAARSTFLALTFPSAVRWYEPQSELSFPLANANTSYPWFDNYFVDRQAAAARWLSANTSPDAVIASTPAGAIAYYANRRVIDMLGLTDVHIAHSPGTVGGDPGKGRAGHEKGDGSYVLSRSPDYILMGNVAVLPFPLTDQRMADKLVLKSEHELWQDPDFHSRYELVCVRLPGNELFRYFSFYQRKDLGQLAAEKGASCWS